MKSIKKSMSLLLCVCACLSMNAFAIDTSGGAAQLETTIPPPEGALPPDQIPPILSKPAVEPQPVAAPVNTQQTIPAPVATTPVSTQPTNIAAPQSIPAGTPAPTE